MSDTSVKIEPLTGPEFTEQRYLIVFADLTEFTAATAELTDRQLAALAQQYYQRAAEIVDKADGRIVKFIGDAALIIFDETAAEAGILAMLKFKQRIDEWLSAIGYPGHVEVKAHLGSLIAGEFGAPSDRRFDIIGADVNFTARLAGGGFVLSQQAFQTLSAAARKHFYKQSLPVSYIARNYRD